MNVDCVTTVKDLYNNAYGENYSEFDMNDTSKEECSEGEIVCSNYSFEDVGKSRSRDEYNDDDDRHSKRIWWICVREEASDRNIDTVSFQSKVKNRLNTDEERW